MSWIIYLSHGFNPFIIMIFINNKRNDEGDQSIVGIENIFETILASLIFYTFWLGAHYLVLNIKGTESAIYSFMGIDKGLTYFLPLILGAVLLINEYVIRPQIETEARLATISLLSTLIFVFGCYFMLINYMAWLSE